MLVDAGALKVGDEIVIPLHIKWSDNPRFKYLVLVDDVLEFRASDTGASAVFLAAATSDAALIREIDDLFQHCTNVLALATLLPQAPRPAAP